MQPEFHEFEIGEKKYQAIKMNAFSAAKHLTKLKGLLDKGLAQGGNANAIQLLSGIDETTLENIILPLLKDAATTSLTDSKKIDSAAGMNAVFDVDTLFDFYELTWEVLKLNFSPFFSKVLSLFGLSPEELANRVKSLAQSSTRES
ncbi:phage tail assembly chaperone [Serratia ficaria]|uniref:phage tail assembly chaperone n=1 Tax=Serratia ficaria TaxID=61651 RepID=UPI00217C189D|nr:hypothetical protein [Serratia ficaria]CAI1141350.1 Uncharacterised protein [Serratia ficaria]CAI2016434.1 Uncharacterised protein [Serratia ficaria]